MMAVAKKIHVSKIDPNPHRNFEIDPIDWDHVDKLAGSYLRLKDFGTLTARPAGDRFELACGHHRFEAMKQAGFKEVDVKVMDLDRLRMIQIMAEENMTQRGGRPSAIQDGIAAAMEYIIEELLRYSDHDRFAELSPLHGTNVPSKKAWAAARGYIQSGEGLGANLLWEFTGKHTGLRTVKESIGSLKADGEVGQIIERVIDKLEAESEAERLEAERLEAERIEAERLEAERQEAEERRLAEAEAQAAKDEAAREKARAAAAERAAKRKAETEAKAKVEAKAKAEAQAKAKAEAEARKAARKAAQEKLAEKIPREALNMFNVGGHQDTFRKLLLEHFDMFSPDQHVELADSLIRRAKMTNKESKLTTDGIEKAFAATIREGKIWTREMQREEEERIRAMKEKQEQRSVELKVERLEGELRTKTRALEKTVVEYTKLLRDNPEAETLVNIFTYRQDVRTLINALVAFDKMFGGKLDYYFDDIEEVQN